MLKLLKPILKNLRWILLPFTLYTMLLFIEAGTDGSGITDGENGIMCIFWALFIVNVALIYFNKQWHAYLDKHLS